MSYDGTVRTSEVFVPLTEKYILMTYFRRVMPLLAQSKHSHLENKSPLNQRCVQRENSSKAFTILSSMLALALTLAPTVLPAEAADNDIDQGGRVLPAAARPHGYTLGRMASLLAFFNSTGNHLLFYPFPQFPDRSDPFQIRRARAGHTFCSSECF